MCWCWPSVSLIHGIGEWDGAVAPESLSKQLCGAPMGTVERRDTDETGNYLPNGRQIQGGERKRVCRTHGGMKKTQRQILHLSFYVTRMWRICPLTLCVCVPSCKRCVWVRRGCHFAWRGHPDQMFTSITLYCQWLWEQRGGTFKMSSSLSGGLGVQDKNVLSWTQTFCDRGIRVSAYSSNPCCFFIAAYVRRSPFLMYFSIVAQTYLQFHAPLQWLDSTALGVISLDTFQPIRNKHFL